MIIYELTPDELLDFGWDYTDWLDGDTIASSTWTVDAGISTATPGNDATTTSMWFSGATQVAGALYKAKNVITTAAGRTASRTFVVKIVSQKVQ